jgi:hypothetical protein
MAFVYRHIRLDNGNPFYIGIGKSEARAYSKKGRSKFWQRIVDKCGYEVEILFDNLDYEQAKLKEQEFISIYGRANICNGLLCNLTDGGDGSLGYKPTEEALSKISKTSKGRVKSADQIEKWKSSMNFTKSHETREKIRQSLLGKHHTDERKENQRKAQLGKKLSNETKLKIGLASKGRKNPPISEETRKKMSESRNRYVLKQQEIKKLLN